MARMRLNDERSEMFQVLFLRVAPPRLVAAFMRYVLPAAFVLRWLVQSVFGILCLSVALYWATWTFSETRPLTGMGLALWVDDLPTEAKAAALTIVMSVIGFLIAFHTASASWKAQARAKMQLDAAEEIEAFFNEFLTKAFQMQLIAKRLLRAVRRAKAEGVTPDTLFDLRYAFSSAASFRTLLDRLSVMASDMHRLRGRHGTMLMSIAGATEYLSDCIDASDKVVIATRIYIPIFSEEDASLFAAALRVDEDAFSNFIETCLRYHGVIGALSGGVRGLLLAPMTNFNLAWLVNMNRLSPAVEEGFGNIQRAKQQVAVSAKAQATT
jgi:hypothetical protein